MHCLDNGVYLHASLLPMDAPVRQEGQDRSGQVMDYLLVGNGPTASLAAAASKANVIVQINDCPHADALPGVRTRYIFVTNISGAPLVSPMLERLASRREHFPHARVVLARNPTFYTVKKSLLRSLRRPIWCHYQLTHAATRLRAWPMQTVSWFSAFRLERQLRALGMPPSLMPSTGMVAYDWLRRRLRTGDSLAVEGFTFQGWEGHPWQIESQLIRPKELPYPWEAEGFFRNGMRVREKKCKMILKLRSQL